MLDIAEILKNKKSVSSKGGEKNYIIHQFLMPINTARARKNIGNYKIARKSNKTLSKDDFKRTEAYLEPYKHSRIICELKKAYGEWKNITTSMLYTLLSECKQSDNFYLTFCIKLKKQREKRKKPLTSNERGDKV